MLSDVTFAVRVDGTNELATIGKAYTGLTDAEIAEMTALLLEITVSDHGHYRTVDPRIVLEVAFDAVQASARHRSGFALRFPRIARWRHDKPVAEIDTLSRVREPGDGSRARTRAARGPDRRLGFDAVAQVHDAAAEPALVEQLEAQPHIVGERLVPTATQHRMQEEMTFVDQPRTERVAGQLRAADADVGG